MAEYRLPHPLAIPAPVSNLRHDAASSASAPKTPERPIPQLGSIPAVSAPASRFRVRRHTGSRALSGTIPPLTPLITQTDANEVLIPSIEVAVEDSVIDPHDHIQTPAPQSADFLSPMKHHFGDLPTTPILQTVSFDGDTWQTARQRGIRSPGRRPASVCSDFSTSSDESDVSSSFASSYGGTTCTSPDRGPADPFATPSKDDRYQMFSDSLMKAAEIPDLPPTGLKLRPKWSKAMDDHLWTTYQIYLQDPTVTPIKIMPGNAPPLGVCHRVARRAKQTWREPKLRVSTASAARFSTPQPADGSDEAHAGDRNSFSDTSAGTSSISQKPQSAHSWPRANATRRRLRQLAKNRATIPTHYMRLLASRSPSPLPSSGSSRSRQTRTGTRRSADGQQPRRRTSPSSPNMGTRSVRLALATATSETMQPDGPLARLQRDTPEPTPERTAEQTMDLPLSLNHHQEHDLSSSPTPQTTATPATLELDANEAAEQQHDHTMNDAHYHPLPPRLGSPFVPNRNHTWTAPGRRQRLRSPLVSSTFSPTEDAPSPDSTVRLARPQELLRPTTSTGPRSLRSPIQFTSTFPYNRSLGSKRRAEHSLEDVASPRPGNSHRRPALNDVFGPALTRPETSEGPSPLDQRRVRLRGFSLNDVFSHHQHERQAMHQPLSSAAHDNDDPFVDSGSGSGSGRHAPPHSGMGSLQPLGSPFQAAEGMTRPRFRVRHLPHNSLDSYPLGLFGSIGERLGDL